MCRPKKRKHRWLTRLNLELARYGRSTRFVNSEYVMNNDDAYVPRDNFGISATIDRTIGILALGRSIDAFARRSGHAILIQPRVNGPPPRMFVVVGISKTGAPVNEYFLCYSRRYNIYADISIGKIKYLISKRFVISLFACLFEIKK